MLKISAYNIGVAKKLAHTLAGVAILSISIQSAAADKNHLFIGPGLFSPSLGKYSTEENGNSEWANKILPIIFIHYDWNNYSALGSSLFLSSSLGLTPFGSKSTDNTYTTYFFPAGFLLGYRLTSFDFKAGPGFFISGLGGSGGQVSQNNGSSSSDFLQPHSMKTTFNFTWNLSFGFHWSSFYSSLEGFITSPLSARRGLNLMVTIQYELF